MSVHWPIIKQLMAHPRRTAVVDDSRSYTGFELLFASQHVAGALAKTCRTKTVGLLLPTSGAFPIAALGAWTVGKTLVPLNYLLRRDELQYVVDDSQTDTIVAVKPMLDFLGYTPKCKNLILLEDLNFKSVPKPRLPKRIAEAETAALVYTSGTSGKPKGVMLSHGAMRANIWQGATHMELKPTDSFLGVLPQFHSYGLTQLTMTPLTYGVPVYYTARFMPKKIVELVRQHQPTVMVGIPSMYNMIAQVKSATPHDFDSLRMIVSGSEPLPDAVFDRFHDKFGKEIKEGYGMTEMAPATHCCVHGKRHSVGRPLPGVEQRVVDIESGEDLPAGYDGEIRLRGPNLMQGYFRMPEVTADSFDEYGFYKTGDIGHFDDDGALFITGRLKEMMIVGGENVFPREIEDVLNRHPLIAASGAVGIKDTRHGEVPIAFVQLTEEAIEQGDHQDEALAQQLIAWCRENLAPYKIPREVRIIDELPRNPTGKVLRRELKSLFEQGSLAVVAA